MSGAFHSVWPFATGTESPTTPPLCALSWLRYAAMRLRAGRN